MGIFSWFGSNAKVEEALYNSRTYNVSPEASDINAQKLKNWEDFAYEDHVNSATKSTLTLVSNDDRPLSAPKREFDENLGWVQTNKR